MLTNSTEIRVRYADTDKMQFVYNGKYLEYFEDDADPVNIIFICNRDSTVNSIEKFIYRHIRDNEYLNANIYTVTKDQIEENGMEISLFKKAEVD